MRATFMKSLRVGALLLAATPLLAAPPPKSAPAAAAAAPESEDARTLYALGLVVGRNLAGFALTPAELATVRAGIESVVNGTPPAVDITVYGPKIQDLQRRRMAAIAEKEHAAGAAYLATAAAQSGAIRSASGAIVLPLTPGSGANPSATDRVKVQYEGKLIDGTVFDTTRTKGEPATFALSGVIHCWTEALPLMQVGGRSRVTCPAELAYGDRGSPPLIRPGATLVFEIELLEIVH